MIPLWAQIAGLVVFGMGAGLLAGSVVWRRSRYVRELELRIVRLESDIAVADHKLELFERRSSVGVQAAKAVGKGKPALRIVR